MQRIIFLVLILSRVLDGVYSLPQPQIAYNPSTDVEAQDRAANAGLPAPEAVPLSSSIPASPLSSYSPSPVADSKIVSVTPPSSTWTSPATHTSGYGDNKASGRNTCVLYSPPNMVSTLQMCKNICGNAVAKQVEAGNTSSVSCISWTPFGSNPQVKEEGMTMTPGNCTCNEPLLDQLADTYVKALPIVAEFGCELLMTTLKLVAEVGALAIPGVGEAIDGGMILAISAAKLISYAYDGGSAALGAFQAFANPCDAVDLPPDMQKVFNILQMVSPMVIPKGGFKVPPKIGKGSAKPADKSSPNTGNPDHSTPDNREPGPPTQISDTGNSGKDSKKNADDKSKDKDKDSDQCQKQKRGDTGGKNKDCKASKTVTLTSIPSGSSSTKLVTSTLTCSGKQYGQACYNYYSAIQHMKGKKAEFTCTDSHSERPHGLTVVAQWSRQHYNARTWRNYASAGFLYQGADHRSTSSKPSCQADEWPPAYFMKPEDDSSQIVRYLPRAENAGAASLWAGWCKKHDGGAGNSQMEGDQINKELVRLDRKRLRSSKTIHNKRTTVYELYKAEVTRAVFSLEFDWAGDTALPGGPNDGNKWGLEANPCWPRAILPNNPDFVLHNQDPWFLKHLPKQDLRPLYAGPPSDDLIAAASKWLKHHKEYVTIGTAADARAADPPPTHNKRENLARLNSLSHNADSSSKQWLEILNDGLALRDMNVSRRLTGREMERDIEVIPCADRTCSREQEYLADSGNAVLVRTQRSETSSPARVEAVLTRAPIESTTMETHVAFRPSITQETTAATSRSKF